MAYLIAIAGFCGLVSIQYVNCIINTIGLE